MLAASEADRDSLPARLADRTVCIGPARAGDSYLRVETIVQAALGVGADAVHPGYGFLVRASPRSRACASSTASSSSARPRRSSRRWATSCARAAAAEAAGVPVVPGGSVDRRPRRRASWRGGIGVPLLVKAVGGGGGRGMKLVHELAALPAALELAAAEAQAAFGDARLYLERFVARGRHVEVQVLGDGAGRVIHLGERDCSVQRRYQKLIEEAPAPRSGAAPAARAARGGRATSPRASLTAAPARSSFWSTSSARTSISSR